MQGTQRTPGRPAGSRTTTKRNPEIAEIRKWAQENGYEVSSRGRIHQNIQDAYYKAMGKESK